MSPAQPVRRFSHGSRVPGWDEAADLTKPPAVVPDPAVTEVPEDLRDAIEAAMAKYPDRRSAAIPALHLAQRLHGWCSPEAIAQVACVMRLTPAYLTSVATFYDMFSLVPKGRHDVYVCTNISCSLRGGDEILEAMERAALGHEGEFAVRGFECLGACDIAPMASVDGEFVGPLTVDDCDRIVADVLAGRAVLDHKALRHRACADPEVAEESHEFGPPGSDVPHLSAAGLHEAMGSRDRPGPSAAIEVPTDYTHEAGETTEHSAGSFQGSDTEPNEGGVA